MEILGLINVPLWAVLILALTALFYFYSTRQFGIFTAMGVKGPKPWPVLGNFNFRKGFVEAYNDWFQEYGRVFGIYEGAHPMLNVGDLDMLREITVKEFVNFPNRRNFGAAEVAEPPVNEFLTIMEDDTWRHNRNTLTPTFSGGKLKKMVGLIVEASQQMADVLKAKADSGEPVEMKEYTGPFTMDVIASTAFGIKINAQENHDDPFVKYARKFFDQSVLSLGLLVLFFFPFMKPVLRFFKVPISPPDSIAFFCDVVKRALEERRNNPGKYVDFVQLMINAKDEADSSVDNEPTDGATEQTGTDAGHWKDKRKGKGLTDSEISAHAIIFFAAGYDTTASTLTYLLYHLAKNPDCMDKLSEEIDQHLPDGKDPDYEIVNKLPYLEMVLSEGLRINPPIARMDRICKKETTVNGIKIPVGMTVALPIFMIHHDPGYWPDPETFDPERFTPENRATHHPLQWIPFGYGPRNCIGMRLAVLEMKIVIVKLLQKYRFVPNSKTKPLRFAESPFLSRTQDGVWLTVEHRK